MRTVKTVKITMRKPENRKTYVLGEDNKELLLTDDEVKNLSNHIQSVHQEEFTEDGIGASIEHVLNSISEISFNVCCIAWSRI